MGIGSLLPDCSSPSFNTPECNNASAGVVVPYTQADCPHPLKFNPAGTIADSSQSIQSPDQICVYPCPDPMFSDYQWDTSTGLIFALGGTCSTDCTHTSLSLRA
jgi:hypothetical protein